MRWWRWLGEASATCRAWAVLSALGCAPAPLNAPPPPRTLSLLHTADIHSRLWPFRHRVSYAEAALGLGRSGELQEVGGAARLATLLERERERAPAATVWLDSGDALEGAEVFHRFGGRVELELLSQLGLGAAALGNHELSLSATELAQRLGEAARYPVLAANLEAKPDSPLFGLLRPSAVLEVGGLRVGVVGVANPTSPPNLATAGNRWQLQLAPSTAGAAQLALDELRPRVELLVVLSHLGLDADRELVAETSGIDLVLGGHQHLLTPEPEWQDDCRSAALQRQRGCSPRRVAIVHSGAYGEWLSRLQLGLIPDPAWPGEVEVETASLEQLPVAQDVPEQAEVARFLEELRPPDAPPLAYLPLGLARRAALGGDSPLGNLTTDALRAASGADVALLNTSGLRADLEAGPLLQSDLELAFPFDDGSRRAWLTGRRLREGLLRAAYRTAARGCESTLQASGLRLLVRCAACTARAADCLEVTLDTPLGSQPLGDDQLLLVTLPAYLTLPGADFESAAAGELLAGTVAEAVARHLPSFAPASSPAACAAELLAASGARCREAFGVVGCPLDAERAWASCRALPEVRGARDDRIQVLP